jgi:hypothetical protein
MINFMGKDVQPLQSVKLVYQRAHDQERLRTLARLIYRIKFNLSLALYFGISY